MRLEAITLHGFKSFGDRTELKILPGISAIVGPNGCGKSNISDAVRWALGEQSAKTLRGHRMEDLIFHGSASRKPVGLAEVELRFSNDGTLAVPWSEVSVSRRLYRTGESEYLLNKGVARLRDILDLFAGTGANPRAYSVMDQEKLNHVLTAKPHERRVFIEEAAGIARYKQQRNETQGKLDAARQNLQRVRDVMDEVKRQLGSLERQARRAQQYKALEAERRDLAVALLAADHAALAADLTRIAGELTGLRDAEQAVRVRLAQLAGREATQRSAIQDSDHRLGDLRQALQKVQAEMERLLERREQMGVQLRDAAEEARRLDEELRNGVARREALVGERGALRDALGEAERAVAERADTAAGLDGTLQAHRAGLAEERDRLEALRLEQVRAAGERTGLTRSAGELRERLTQLARRTERLAGEQAEAEREAGRLAAAHEGLAAARRQAGDELATLGGERERLVASLVDREAELAAAETRLGEARVAAASRRSSLEALTRLERAREGYGAGVRSIFAEGTGLGGIVGTVADLLEVPPELERPVEAVLGERLEWVVVERFADARAAVDYLRRTGVGTATFLPLDTLGTTADGVPEDNGARWLVRRVAARSDELLQHLLGQVALVEHLDQAEALWRRNGVVATYVTPGGEVLGPTGRLRGGSGGEETQHAHSLLGRRREIRQLEDALAALDLRVEAGQREVAVLGGEVQALRLRRPVLDEAIQAREAARLSADKDLEQAGREQERTRRHLETVRLEAGQLSTESGEASAMLALLEQRLGAAREAEAAHETAMLAGRQRLEESGERERALVAELTACRIAAASARERLEAMGRDLLRLDQMEAELIERLERARERQAQLGERRVWLAEERERTDLQAREVAGDRDRVEGEAREAAARHADLVGELEAIEVEARAVQSELSRLIAGVHDRELEATERRVRREELAQEAGRTYGLDGDALLERHDPARDLEAVRLRLAELHERVEAIGPVNLVADEEYRELDERLGFLRVQHDDLTGSIRDLERALRGMTKTAEERFSEAFEQISARFSEIFARLFEGGRAELALVEPEEGADPLDTGVELMAQPRGKRLQSVTLLSGGERALTGLALLFAIFYFRPSPFCILDEVDAPLDDANIHRFVRVLGELTERTQFLVITHNRKTMEAADVLYGVTMEEPGLSKLVAVNLR